MFLLYNFISEQSKLMISNRQKKFIVMMLGLILSAHTRTVFCCGAVREVFRSSLNSLYKSIPVFVFQQQDENIKMRIKCSTPHHSAPGPVYDQKLFINQSDPVKRTGY